MQDSDELPEPMMDLSGFRLEHGSIQELMDQMKQWVEWRLRQMPRPEA